MHSEARVIIDGGVGVIVGPDVERYAVHGNYVVGFVGTVPPFSEGHENNERGALGYFVLDTDSGDLVLNGFSVDAWEATLREKGVAGFVDLKWPDLCK